MSEEMMRKLAELNPAYLGIERMETLVQELVAELAIMRKKREVLEDETEMITKRIKFLEETMAEVQKKENYTAVTVGTDQDGVAGRIEKVVTVKDGVPDKTVGTSGSERKQSEVVEWIPVDYEVDEENQEIFYWRCRTPEPDETVLITLSDGTVCMDDFDDEYGFDSFGADAVLAWMPLPAPYEKEAGHDS